ncbi:MAG: glutamate--tRNA ligase [Thermodesulfobacteriota bacterium]
MDTIVTRFPPSPTGFLHIGGARTALFNWLYSRHNAGRFVLRIEDTDVERSTRESVDAIFEALQWLGIDWDEGPYYQSERFAVYRQSVERLIETGQAYYCTCSAERLEQMREAAKKRGENPRYDGTCRNRGLSAAEDAVVRFKSPQIGNTVVEDTIRGNIVFSNAEIDDFIICRSDGTPMYNLAVVVDDIAMEINTIIRGDDHISNTPKQVLLYRALDAPVPVFGHVPMVLGGDKTRLSKRHGAMSVTAYRDMGYLPDALLNYLVRLGWSYGDQEFFTRDELIEKFTLQHIGKSAGVFNPEKLLALNAEHIRNSPEEKIAPHLLPFLRQKGIHAEAGPFLYAVIATLQPRSKTLVEMADGAEFYFKAPDGYDEKGAKKFFKPELVGPLNRLTDALAEAGAFDETALEPIFKQVMADTGLGFGKLAQPLRLAVTGKTVSPGIFEMLEVLGRDETVSRLRRAIARIEAGAAPEG